MDRRLAESLINIPHRVCGIRLAPFSLWHSLLLDLYDSPIVRGHRSTTESDFLTALGICKIRSRSDSHALGYFQRARAAWFLHRAPEVETAGMLSYLADYNDFPKISGVATTGDRLKTQWQFNIFCRLQRFTNYSADQAWFLPLGEAIHISAALVEINGGKLNMVSAEDEDFISRLEKEQADPVAEAELQAQRRARGLAL
jgi:hypothetical protein